MQTGCPLPVPNSFVIDYAKVIDQTTNDVLERKLRNLKSSGNIDFAVVLVDTTGEMSIFDYSLALSRCWSVGGKNPDKAGLLLLIAVNDRKWHIQISRVLEKVLSNDDVHRIGDKMAPYFKQSRYGEGVNKSVDTMIETLAKRRGFFISKA